MKFVDIAFMLSLVLAACAQATAFVLIGQWLWIPLWVSLALLMWLGRLRSWSWAASLSLVGFIASAAYGSGIGGAPLLLLLAVTSALAAWDLAYFTQRLSNYPHSEALTRLVAAHLKQLALVIALGLLAAGLGISLHIDLSFGVAFVLVLALALALNQAIRFLSQRPAE